MRTRAVLIFLVTIIFLAWYAIAFGAPLARPVCQEPGCVERSSEFPFTSTKQRFEGSGWHFVDSEEGNCFLGSFISVRLINAENSVGWRIWFTEDRLVAMRVQLIEGNREAIIELITFALIEAGNIRVLSEVSYDPEQHKGPCQWLDMRES